MDWKPKLLICAFALFAVELTQLTVGAETPLPPNVTLVGPHVCQSIEKVISGVKLERYSQNVTLETIVSCSDPFQNFRCKETRTGTRINYKSVPKEVEQIVEKCCEGYAQTQNLTCEKLAEPQQFVQTDSNQNSNFLITLVIASLATIVLITLLFALYYRRKVVNKKKFEHAVKYTSNSAGHSDDEDEVDNRVFRPDFVTPTPVRLQPNELKVKTVEADGETTTKPHQNVYVELGDQAGSSIRDDGQYETIPSAYRASNPISFENPNLYPKVPSPNLKGADPRV
ncbi:hypothetical protein M3Y94_00716500 [Aphelenchoides besseyi]|nr:hypothetical protein M3Y94_00716500 [Aphelenchoides besseyi]